MEHTVGALQVKADSILQTILGNNDYDELVAGILVQKNAIDSTACCGTLSNDTTVQIFKVIAIKCPVDVHVYNENGTEIVNIMDDTLESAADGISVYIRDRQKYIALPADQVYTIKIIATDDGTMEYVVCEYNEQVQLHRTIRKSDIPLVSGRVFAGKVASQLDVDEGSYELSYDKPICNHMWDDGVITTPAGCETDGMKTYTCTVCGETKTEVIPATGEEILWGDASGDGKVNAMDATRILRYAAKLITEDKVDLIAADVNGDGRVNAMDATRILRYAAKLIPTLRVEK